MLLPAVDVFNGTFVPWRGPVLLLGSLALTLFNMRRDGLSHRAGLVIVVVLPLLVYLLDLSPYVGRADTFEFQVTALRLGIAHPTGYPLYVLLGKLFTLLPFGTLAWKVNLTSAICAAAAVGVVYLLIYRLARHTIIAVLAALALAWSSTLWSQAIVAEVYALNLLFVAGALWLALDILESHAMPQTLWRAALLLGLSLTNHITMVMLLPALSAAYDWYRYDHLVHGVIVHDEVIARKGNAASYQPAFTEPLAEGTEFRLVEDRGDWYLIRLAGGQEGWVEKEAVVAY